MLLWIVTVPLIPVVQYFELALLMAISIRPIAFQDVKQKKGKNLSPLHVTCVVRNNTFGT